MPDPRLVTVLTACAVISDATDMPIVSADHVLAILAACATDRAARSALQHLADGAKLAARVDADDKRAAERQAKPSTPQTQAGLIAKLAATLGPR